MLRSYPQTFRTLTIDLSKINAKETMIVAMGEPVDTRQNIFFEQKISCKVTSQLILDFLKDALKVFGEIDTLLIDFYNSDLVLQYCQEKSIKVIQLNSHFPGFKSKIERYLKQRNSQPNPSWRNSFNLRECPPDLPRKSKKMPMIPIAHVRQYYGGQNEFS